MLPKSSKTGFTIVELLVTITIIAILAAIGLVVYSDVLPKARDGKRKQDLGAIAQALRIYYEKNGRYPCTPDFSTFSVVNTSLSSGTWITDDNICSIPNIPLDATYISQLPQDPKQDGSFKYSYWAGNTSVFCSGVAHGQYYVLFARLENAQDPDVNSLKQYKGCQGNRLFSEPRDDALFVITSQD